jgi:hypothetical protein
MFLLESVAEVHRLGWPEFWYVVIALAMIIVSLIFGDF